LAVAAVFAPLHAFKPSRVEMEVTHDVSGALEAIGAWLAQFGDLARIGPSMVGLFLLSLLLSAAWNRSRTLWAPIGIHAGGVWVVRSYGSLTDRDPQRTWAGTKELYDGPVAWAVLLVAAVLLWPRRTGRGGT
jgi:membrane protease YdiL (CAAX protease family)